MTMHPSFNAVVMIQKIPEGPGDLIREIRQDGVSAAVHKSALGKPIGHPASPAGDSRAGCGDESDLVPDIIH